MNNNKEKKEWIKLLINSLKNQKTETPLNSLKGYGYLMSNYSMLINSSENYMPSDSLKQQLSNLSGLLKKLSGDTQPMYLTPWELLQKMPTLTLGQLCTELNWLYKLYN